MIHLASSHCCPLQPCRLKTSCTLATTSPRTPVRSTSPELPPPHGSFDLIQSHMVEAAFFRKPPGTGFHGPASSLKLGIAPMTLSHAALARAPTGLNPPPPPPLEPPLN